MSRKEASTSTKGWLQHRGLLVRPRKDEQRTWSMGSMNSNGELRHELRDNVQETWPTLGGSSINECNSDNRAEDGIHSQHRKCPPGRGTALINQPAENGGRPGVLSDMEAKGHAYAQEQKSRHGVKRVRCPGVQSQESREEGKWLTGPPATTNCGRHDEHQAWPRRYWTLRCQRDATENKALHKSTLLHQYICKG